MYGISDLRCGSLFLSFFLSVFSSFLISRDIITGNKLDEKIDPFAPHFKCDIFFSGIAFFHACPLNRLLHG